MDDTQKQIAELGEKLARLESLRPDLGDAVTDKTKAELASQLRALIQTGGGAVVAGDVKAGLPGLRGPEVVKLCAEGKAWLEGSARPGEPL